MGGKEEIRGTSGGSCEGRKGKKEKDKGGVSGGGCKRNGRKRSGNRRRGTGGRRETMVEGTRAGVERIKKLAEKRGAEEREGGRKGKYGGKTEERRGYRGERGKGGGEK